MKFKYLLFVMTIFTSSCKTKESKLTSSTWLLKEYNCTINSKITKLDKSRYLNKYKEDFAVTFFIDNHLDIELGDSTLIKLSWKLSNNKGDLVIYRDKNFQDISRYETAFYGEYLVDLKSKGILKLTRVIIPFEENEEFILEKLD